MEFHSDFNCLGFNEHHPHLFHLTSSANLFFFVLLHRGGSTSKLSGALSLLLGRFPPPPINDHKTCTRVGAKSSASTSSSSSSAATTSSSTSSLPSPWTIFPTRSPRTPSPQRRQSSGRRSRLLKRSSLRATLRFHFFGNK